MPALRTVINIRLGKKKILIWAERTFVIAGFAVYACTGAGAVSDVLGFNGFRPLATNLKITLAKEPHDQGKIAEEK